MTKLTNEQLAQKVAELEAALEMEKQKGVNMKTRIRNLLDSGVNSLDQLAIELQTTHKNISSSLTALRKELSSEGKTIITQQHKGKTMIAVLELKTLGW